MFAAVRYFRDFNLPLPPLGASHLASRPGWTGRSLLENTPLGQTAGFFASHSRENCPQPLATFKEVFLCPKNFCHPRNYQRC